MVTAPTFLICLLNCLPLTSMMKATWMLNLLVTSCLSYHLTSAHSAQTPQMMNLLSVNLPVHLILPFHYLTPNLPDSSDSEMDARLPPVEMSNYSIEESINDNLPIHALPAKLNMQSFLQLHIAKGIN